MTTSADEHVSLRGISKSFNVKGAEFIALENISLQIRAGEFVSIVGASGCGKSTLLRIIAGLERASVGTVELNGQAILGPGRDRGLVFQEHRLLPWLTVWDNVAFALDNASTQQTRELIRAHLDLVGLTGFEKAYPHQLSGGMSQRAAIARTLVKRPEVMLLDEPFGALDALTRIQLQQEILRIWQAERTTMILVTHDIDEAIYLSDRVLILSSRPGTVKNTILVDLPRPRQRGSLEFSRLRKAIYREFFAEEEALTDYMI